MSERKLLVGPDADGSTFAAAFRAAAKLPTQEQTKEAMEKSFRGVIREDLHRDSAYRPDTQRDTRRPAGTNGWMNEVPIGPPPGIAIIDQLCNTLMPHEPLHGADLEKLLAKVGITREQFEARVAERVKQIKAGAR